MCPRWRRCGTSPPAQLTNPTTAPGNSPLTLGAHDHARGAQPLRRRLPPADRGHLHGPREPARRELRRAPRRLALRGRGRRAPRPLRPREAIRYGLLIAASFRRLKAVAPDTSIGARHPYLPATHHRSNSTA